MAKLLAVRVACSLFVLTTLHAADLPAADQPSAAPALQLPRVKVAAGPDGPKSWRGQGLELTALAGDMAQLAAFNTFGAQARLGWNEEGVVAWIEVRDSTPYESSDNDHLYEGDSVSLLVNGPDPKAGQIELVAAAGGTPTNASPRSSAADYRTLALRTSNGAARGTAVMRRTKSGYVAQLMVPWPNFGAAAKIGDEYGVRVTIIDRASASGPRSRLLFALPGQPYDFFDLPRVRLAEKPMGAPAALAWCLYDEYLISIAINVVAERNLVGALVQVLDDNKIIASGKLVLDGPRAVVRLVAAAAPVGKKNGDIRVHLAGKELAVPPLADLVAERHRVFLNGVSDRQRYGAGPPSWSQPRFSATVFGAEAFPSFSYPEPARITALVGDIAITVAYYDSAGNKVQEAKTPGRYGAIVTLKASDGTTAVCHHTLFRRPAGDTEEGDPVARAAAFEKKPVNPIKADRDWWHSLRKKLGTQIRYEYFVRTPSAYDADKNKRWPIIVFLHGSGGGDSMQNVQTSGPQVPAQHRANFPFIVLSLRSPGGWYPPAVEDVIDEVAAKYRTDVLRTYIVGFSMGAMGTWDVLFDQPHRFAAASPVGGRRGHPERAEEIKHVPVWVWNGAIDSTTTPADAKAAVAALVAVGGNVKYTEIPGAGHTDSHDFVFHGTALYDWLLTQRRAP